MTRFCRLPVVCHNAEIQYWSIPVDKVLWVEPNNGSGSDEYKSKWCKVMLRDRWHVLVALTIDECVSLLERSTQP